MSQDTIGTVSTANSAGSGFANVPNADDEYLWRMNLSSVRGFSEKLRDPKNETEITEWLKKNSYPQYPTPMFFEAGTIMFSSAAKFSHYIKNSSIDRKNTEMVLKAVLENDTGLNQLLRSKSDLTHLLNICGRNVRLTSLLMDHILSVNDALTLARIFPSRASYISFQKKFCTGELSAYKQSFDEKVGMQAEKKVGQGEVKRFNASLERIDSPAEEQNVDNFDLRRTWVVRQIWVIKQYTVLYTLLLQVIAIASGLVTIAKIASFSVLLIPLTIAPTFLLVAGYGLFKVAKKALFLAGFIAFVLTISAYVLHDPLFAIALSFAGLFTSGGLAAPLALGFGALAAIIMGIGYFFHLQYTERLFNEIPGNKQPTNPEVARLKGDPNQFADILVPGLQPPDPVSQQAPREAAEESKESEVRPKIQQIHDSEDEDDIASPSSTSPSPP